MVYRFKKARGELFQIPILLHLLSLFLYCTLSWSFALQPPAFQLLSTRWFTVTNPAQGRPPNPIFSDLHTSVSDSHCYREHSSRILQRRPAELQPSGTLSQLVLDSIYRKMLLTLLRKMLSRQIDCYIAEKSHSLLLT